ncbi:hypothetical protein RUM44_001567 [Polyplax serrata]
MTLLKAMGYVCFQNHLKKIPVESNDTFMESNDRSASVRTTPEVKNEAGPEEKTKREVGKPKSPFTVVNRNVQTSDTVEQQLGERVPDKDKDI